MPSANALYLRTLPRGPSRVESIRSPPGDLSFVPYLAFMSEWHKANVEGAQYFITITVGGWIDVLTRKELVARPAPC